MGGGNAVVAERIQQWIAAGMCRDSIFGLH